MITLAASVFSTKVLGWLAALGGAGFVIGYGHQGSFDASAIADAIDSEVVSTSAAVTASGTFPANGLTGAGTVCFTNTTSAPGTLTTRTASQMYLDAAAQLGQTPPIGSQYILILAHSGTGTLTLAGGTGVTVSSLNGTTTSVATTTARIYVVTFTNAQAITIQSLGALAT
jgi:hypothetical protein